MSTAIGRLVIAAMGAGVAAAAVGSAAPPPAGDGAGRDVARQLAQVMGATARFHSARAGPATCRPEVLLYPGWA